MQISNLEPDLAVATQVSVVPAPDGSPERAGIVADALELPLTNDASSNTISLVVGETAAWLQEADVKVSIQFDSPAMLYRRRGGQNELLGRAVGVRADRKPAVFDATGGLGRDAFILADLGCRVNVCERSAVLAWLISEAVSSGSHSRYAFVKAASERLDVLFGDSTFQSVKNASVIYLDPMFPERKKSAAVKKDAVMLQRVAGTSGESLQPLLEWAFDQPVQRIVVKRPLRAESFFSRQPSYTVRGKTVRFDVFVQRIEDASSIHG